MMDVKAMKYQNNCLMKKKWRVMRNVVLRVEKVVKKVVKIQVKIEM